MSQNLKYYWFFLIPVTIASAVLGQFVDVAKYICLGVFFVDLILLFFTILDSIKSSKKSFDEKLPFYFVELLNRGAITRAQYDNRANEKAIIKGYYADYRRHKVRWAFIFIFIFIILLSILLYFFLQL